MQSQKKTCTIYKTFAINPPKRKSTSTPNKNDQMTIVCFQRKKNAYVKIKK